MIRTLARLALRAARGAAYASVCALGAGLALAGCAWGLAEIALLALDPDPSKEPPSCDD